jgi:hypothetical protein
MIGRRGQEMRWKDRHLLMPAWVLRSSTGPGTTKRIYVRINRRDRRKDSLTPNQRRNWIRWMSTLHVYKVLLTKTPKKNSRQRGTVSCVTSKGI